MSEESFREGAVKYMRDSEGKWRFSIIAGNGEIVAQSESYESLGNAKRGAKDLKETMGVEELDE